jgi:hypothetical protein
VDVSLVVAALEANPRLLRALTADCPVEAARRAPAAGQWSIADVACHLTEGDRDTFVPRLRRMLAEERPVFEPFDPEAWARERGHREGRVEDDLDAFATAWLQTVALLRDLAPGAERRLGLSSFLGPVTLERHATHIVDHDLEHERQLGACRAAVVGGGRG